jgi:hypothetical protein
MCRCITDVISIAGADGENTFRSQGSAVIVLVRIVDNASFELL